MAKWRYTGPEYGRGVLLQDDSLIFPEHLDDATIDTVLAKYPYLSPYWRLTDADNDGNPDGNSQFVPLAWWITEPQLNAILDWGAFDITT